MPGNVTIKETGLIQVKYAVDLIGASGKEIANGPIATWGSRVPYAHHVEYIWRRGSGGARMFARGIQETLPMVSPILMEAIPKGPGSVGQAKRKIRDLGIENIRKYTPVRTGRLKASIQEMSRPINPMNPPLSGW